jgi:hypothetical protein
MTEGYVLGHNFRAFIEGVGAGHATSCQYSLDIDSKELSDKDVDPGSTAPGAATLTLGKKRITIQVSGYIVESEDGIAAATGGYADLLDMALDGTLIDWTMTTNVAGDSVLSGTGYITKFSGAGEDGSEATYSFEVKSTGSFGLDSVS